MSVLCVFLLRMHMEYYCGKLLFVILPLELCVLQNKHYFHLQTVLVSLQGSEILILTDVTCLNGCIPQWVGNAYCGVMYHPEGVELEPGKGAHDTTSEKEAARVKHAV